MFVFSDFCQRRWLKRPLVRRLSFLSHHAAVSSSPWRVSGVLRFRSDSLRASCLFSFPLTPSALTQRSPHVHPTSRYWDTSRCLRSWLKHEKAHSNGPVLDDDILADPSVKGCIQKGSKVRNSPPPPSLLLCNIWKNVMSAYMLEVSLLGVRTVLRLERDAWSRVK